MTKLDFVNYLIVNIFILKCRFLGLSDDFIQIKSFFSSLTQLIIRMTQFTFNHVQFLFSSDILTIFWTDLQQYNANWLPNDERLSKTWLSKSQLSSGISIVMTFVVCCLRAQLAAAAHHKSWASTANYTVLVFFVFLSGWKKSL